MINIRKYEKQVRTGLRYKTEKKTKEGRGTGRQIGDKVKGEGKKGGDG